MDVARLNLSPRRLRRPRAVYEWVRAAGRRPPGAGSAILVDLQGPKIRLGDASPTVRCCSSPAPRFTITIDDVPGDVDMCVARPTRVCPATCTPATRILDRRRPGRAARRSRSTTTVGHDRVVEGGRVSDNKGINLPGVAVSVPAHVREGRRRPALGAAPRRRHDRAVVRPQRRRPARAVHDDHGRGGRPPARHRQDREAAGGRQPRGDHRRVRRDHGRPRRPRRGAAARAGAAGAEARDHPRPRPRQAGHRRDPDARVDGVDVAPDARRGQRRRQRGARRRRRADALGRDERRRAPDRSRSRRWRASSSSVEGEALDQLPEVVGPQADSTGGAIARAAVARRRSDVRRQRASSRSPRRARSRAARVALPLADAAPGLHARPRGCAASSRCRGASRPSSSRTVVHTDEMVSRSTRRCWRSAVRRSATPSSSSRASRRASPAPPTACACTAWATQIAAAASGTYDDGPAPAERRPSSYVEAAVSRSRGGPRG